MNNGDAAPSRYYPASLSSSLYNLKFVPGSGTWLSALDIALDAKVVKEFPAFFRIEFLWEGQFKGLF